MKPPAPFDTIKSCLHYLSQQLQDQSTPTLEAEILIAHALAVPRSYLYSHPEYVLKENERNLLHNLLNRRLMGEPIAYILGEKEFWSLPLMVNQHTLIPRPETELLVELTLAKLPKQASIKVADLGTGSGAIALALAQARPHWQIVATDQSLAALQVAQANAQRLHLSNVRFNQGDWCSALGADRFAAIVSNPPYIPRDDPHLDKGDLRFEPKTALAAGEDGLAAFRKIIPQAKHHLTSAGWLLLEHGFDQGSAVRDLMQQAGYQKIQTHEDLTHIGRVTIGCTLSS